MANLIDIVVNATDRASATIANIGKNMQGMADRAERAGGVITGVLGATALAMGAVAVAGVKQNSWIEQNEMKWTALLGTLEQAQDQLKWIQDFAQKSPFDSKGVDQWASSLQMAGIAGEKQRKTIEGIGGAMAVHGKSTEEVSRAFLGYTQALAKGKLGAEEYNQMLEAGMPINEALSKVLGKNIDQVKESVNNGEVSKKQLEEVAMVLRDKYLPHMEKAGSTTLGVFNSMMEGAKRLAGHFTKWLMAPLTGIMQSISGLVDQMVAQFEKGGNGLKGAFDILLSGKLGIAVTVLAGVILGALYGAIVALIPVITTAVVAFAPFLAVGLAIAGLAFLIYKSWAYIEPYFTALWDKVTYGVGIAKSVIQGFVAWMKGDVVSGMTILQNALGNDMAVKVGLAFQTIKNNFITVRDTLVEGWNWVKDAVNTVKLALDAFNLGELGTSADLLNAKFGVFGTIITDAFTIGKQVVDGFRMAWEWLKGAFETAKPIFFSVISMIWQQLQQMWVNIQPVFTQLKAIVFQVVGIFKDLWNILSTTVLPIVIQVAKIIGVVVVGAIVMAIGVINGFIKAFAFIVQAVMEVISFMLDLAMVVVKVLQGDWGGAMDYAKSAIGHLLSAVGNILKAVINFFVGFVQGVWSVIRPWATGLVDKFKEAITNAGNAVKNGVSNIVSGIKNWLSDFISAGAGLIEAFTKGIKDKMTGAIDAVKGGMAKIREFLPFSPAKRGALSDLDKSGESFFPTWYKGALTQVRPMTKAIGGAMGQLNAELASGAGGVTLDAFTGGRSKVTITHQHEHSGTVEVAGDSGSESVSLVAGSVREQTEIGFMSDFRQAVRKR